MNHCNNLELNRDVWRDDMETVKQLKKVKNRKASRQIVKKKTSRLEKAQIMKSDWACKLSAFLLAGLILKWAGRTNSDTDKPTSVSYVTLGKIIPASLPGTINNTLYTSLWVTPCWCCADKICSNTQDLHFYNWTLQLFELISHYLHPCGRVWCNH